MLVFKMDTTGLFKYGQKHEVRIGLPHRDKPRGSIVKSGEGHWQQTQSHHQGVLARRNSSSGSCRRASHHHLAQHLQQEPRCPNSSTSNIRTSKESSQHRLSGNSSGGQLLGVDGRELRTSRSFTGVRDLTQLVIGRRDSTSSGGGRLARRGPRSSTSTAGQRQPEPPPAGPGGGVVAPPRARRTSENATHHSDLCGLLTSLRGRRVSENTVPYSAHLGHQQYLIPPSRRKPEPESNDVTTSTYTKPCSNDESSHGLMTIRMKPDSQGKFGFNVKGGADQNLAILVSRVVPNTAADRCYPRLNEGDQVLFINGRDVSTMSHEQVVNFIRASRECHTGELVLSVKQNVYLGEDLEEPAFQYVPESLPASATVPAGSTAPLQESMLLLAEGLESGAVVAQFEQLYRRKPGLTLNEPRKQENEKKNRYRDISPYDVTRVILTSTPSGDYINGSYVNMEIPGSGIINRYIACQGPLSTTCTDFWVMIWEQQSTLIVMLTTVVEQGRVKCHKYWPRLYESNTFGFLQVTCLKEEETPSFGFRQFTLINTETNEERHISHMQYLAWPDHGVPDDSSEFLDFITQVRQARAGMVEPTIVHCSAGIGRTGVLILMETAQCLIEANEPVYPLDSVRAMRDQRAMMIQTSSQYRFVCEAIQRVYQEGLIKPLSEYQQR